MCLELAHNSDCCCNQSVFKHPGKYSLKYIASSTLTGCKEITVQLDKQIKWNSNSLLVKLHCNLTGRFKEIILHLKKNWRNTSYYLYGEVTHWKFLGGSLVSPLITNYLLKSNIL